MPELPEVETVRCGLAPSLEGSIIKKIYIHHPKLRYPIPQLNHLVGQKIQKIQRRSKYLIFEFASGNLLAHLGMSGIFRLYDLPAPEKLKHDHIEFYFDTFVLRYHDPRRFGAILWSNKPFDQHQLIQSLGPEPLSTNFNSNYLQSTLKTTKKAIKLAIMDSHIVCGVGNIYASEALFDASIHPLTPANKLTLIQCQSLVNSIKYILSSAIKQGGTTLKDFKNSNGKPGYFAQQLAVYAQDKKPCTNCQTPIAKIILGQRSTFYCTECQKLPN
ncbi:bifunctional DNA-formamidopyrimidine glycosylase/DNA-(apurinic or apyrimidinic site) lyase [Thiotrichales bacterium 19S3-7]|nr:bifunctional DNA-formamidopyrimidine glycosylase/DNA-(apurinic or apyrimidinic site) lyase [Thiotrichales bacterium 19S3-7]MCF6801207.1 bifunctional DNA-formamidopyrimidine glycosylase/DNA-(apurinic or apyrimidinic site) lyase [Thiotrichales bacterium 19S3-11]